MDAMTRRVARRIEETEFKSAQREKLAKSGAAMPDGSFPIRNKSDLKNAVQALGRAKNRTATKAHIVKRAKALKATHVLPDDWLNEANLIEECTVVFEAELAELARERGTSIEEAADSLVKANTPQPFSTSKTSNWVARGGGLPDYIQHVAHGLVRAGHSTSEAIGMAVGIVRRWARGGGKIDKNTQAAAALAISQWEQLKAKNKAKSAAS